MSRSSTGGPVGIPRALLRGVLLALVVPALIMDEDRRGVHDRAAGTVVLAAASARPAPVAGASGGRRASP